MQQKVQMGSQVATAAEPEVSLHRWQVLFASGDSWYAVGEFIAVDAAAAIERAIEVIGPGSAYCAQEIPWDAAPLRHQR